MERAIERLLFASRWILAPVYLGLSIALIALGIKFFMELFHLLTDVVSMGEAVDTVAKNPLAGDLLPGTGGCRKVRIAGRGKGKSGGYRVVTFFGGYGVPVFLLTVFSKGERANLSHAERNALGKLSEGLVASLNRKVVALRR